MTTTEPEPSTFVVEFDATVRVRLVVARDSDGVLQPLFPFAKDVDSIDIANAFADDEDVDVPWDELYDVVSLVHADLEERL